MLNLSSLSPYVREVLAENHLEPVQLLRYGPRFICCVVRQGAKEGFFKMVLPLEERRNIANTDYIWTEYDEGPLLERRLIKEALFLQFFSRHLDSYGFRPHIIALSDTSPVWSLRTFINERTMSAWDSDFIFSQRFFDTFTPRQTIDFFVRIHNLSLEVPDNMRILIADFISTLLNPNRFERSIERLREIPSLSHYADQLNERFNAAKPRYADYRHVITHYEPYAPHIYSSAGQMGLIDWENVGWGHQLQDLSVLYMRCGSRPDWQAEYVEILEEYGYFKGNGRLFWESELIIQSLANHKYFMEGGPIGTPEYDKESIKFFESTVASIMKNSEFFSR
jgi:hypothetical protein